MRRPLLASLPALLLSAAPLRAQQPASPALPLVPGAYVVTVTPAPGPYTEPSIAIDPRDPRHAVGVFQNNVHAAWTVDGGHTWTLAEGVEPPNYRVSGDVAVAMDLHGHAFLCSLAFDHTGLNSYWAIGGTRGGVFVRRSLDGGRTWETKPAIVIEHPGTTPGLKWEDKPYIVADNNPHSPFAGHLYVGWTEFQIDRTVILFSRSTDDGKSWSKPFEISTQPGMPRDDNGALVAFDATVGADGTLYASWNDRKGIVLAVSHDGGRTFDPSRLVVPTGPMYFNIASFSRGNGFQEIAIDPRPNAGRHGRLYVAWGDYRNGDIDIFSATSVDGGMTWTPPVRVNSDPVHDGRDQFMQWLAVDPTNGAAYVMFYDRRADTTNIRPLVTLARSTDGGRRYVNYTWTTQPFDPRGESFLGDYTGLAASGGRVYGIWPEEAQMPAPMEHGRQVRNSVMRIGVAYFSGH
ncbi:MAG TPA: hypothetical protein VIC55_02605 [Gemmatimonadaceae bacterium]|jgi:hypothetical protein